jgi:transcriptional regulator with XRE-family HTH domain
MDSTAMDEVNDRERRLSAIRAQLKRMRAERDELRQSLSMDKARRPANLRLLRSYFDETQASFGSLLQIGQTEVSLLERGEKALSTSDKDSIESTLGLPGDWFDRDNGARLFLTNDEMLLLVELRGYEPSVVRALTSVVKELKSSVKADD